MNKNLLGHAQATTSTRTNSQAVLIVDDHAVFAESLGNLLRLCFKVEPVIATCLTAAQRIAQEQLFALAILDVELKGSSGLEVADFLSRHQPQCQLILLSGHLDTLFCPDSLRRRLRAMIDKGQAFNHLQTVLTPLLSGQTNSSNAALSSLTEREQDVYALMGRGLSCKQIATTLNLAVRTVETHRKHIASKLGASGAELTHRATLDAQRQRIDLPVHQE